VVGFTPLPPPQYPAYRRFRWHQSLSGRYENKKNLLPLPAIEPRLLGRPSRSLFAIPERQVDLQDDGMCEVLTAVSPRMWRLVFWSIITDVSEEPAVSNLTIGLGGLFDNAVNISRYLTNSKGFRRTWSWSTWESIPCICLEGMGSITKNPSGVANKIQTVCLRNKSLKLCRTPSGLVWGQKSGKDLALSILAYFPYFLKNQTRLMRSPFCLSVCLCIPT
jgi:hypothetical protein